MFGSPSSATNGGTPCAPARSTGGRFSAYPAATASAGVGRRQQMEPELVPALVRLRIGELRPAHQGGAQGDRHAAARPGHPAHLVAVRRVVGQRHAHRLADVHPAMRGHLEPGGVPRGVLVDRPGDVTVLGLEAGPIGVHVQIEGELEEPLPFVPVHGGRISTPRRPGRTRPSGARSSRRTRARRPRRPRRPRPPRSRRPGRRSGRRPSRGSGGRCPRRPNGRDSRDGAGAGRRGRPG